MTHTGRTLARELLATLTQGHTFIRAPYQGKVYLLSVSPKAEVKPADLLGIEAQKNAFLANTTCFLQGKPYNHMLLWGARGTGKSSLVRACLYHLRTQGLKALQLSCEDLPDLPFLFWVLGQSDSKFLVYMDDLSFDTGEGSYRLLKATLDGSLAGIADNILLCVTSNRRHLINESPRNNDALYPEEDCEEQISLAERFGLRLAFHPLTQAQYLEVVYHLLACPPAESLTRKALQFALARGSRSARVAKQFVNSLGQW